MKKLINTIPYFIFLLVGCIAFKSPFPKNVPADVEFSYAGGNDMSRYSQSITLSRYKGEYRINEFGKKDSLIFLVDSNDIKNLYFLFCKYRIDQIKNKNPSHITYDASREGISMQFGNQSYNVISGSNFPFASREDQKSYNILRKAMFDTYYKYKNKP